MALRPLQSPTVRIVIGFSEDIESQNGFHGLAALIPPRQTGRRLVREISAYSKLAGSSRAAAPEEPHLHLMTRLGNWLDDLDQDKVVMSVLILCTLACALSMPVNPYPRDVWFETQYLLLGRFTGEDNYTPIAVPAVLYKLVHWAAFLMGWNLKQEMYLASFMQNALLFLSACLVYFTCKRVGSAKVAACVAISFLVAIQSTGVAQAFWSENFVLLMFAAVLYLSAKIYDEPTVSSLSTRLFWRRASLSSLLTGFLVVTRMVPFLLIPAQILLFYRRLGTRRLLAYTFVLCVTTALMFAAMLASNHARFGRTELTNSSGRHSWQGVRPMVETALVQSPEFAELQALNPHIQSKNWFELRLPEDARREFDGEQLLGRLAREAIRTHPFRYLRLGIVKFVTAIGRPLPQLGSDSRGNHHLLSADPLHTDHPLPPLGESILKIPALFDAASHAREALRILSSIAYLVAVFLVLTTYGALLIERAGVSSCASARHNCGSTRLNYRKLLQFLLGALLLGVVYLNRSDIWLVTWLERGLCATLLLFQVAITGGGHHTRAQLPSVDTSRDRMAFAFPAFMFFGSLWLSWQVEMANMRNIVPYLPFLSVLVVAALTFWIKEAEKLRAVAD